jgi:magnesium transporter
MLGHLVQLEVEELIAKRDWAGLRAAFEDMDDADLAEVITDLPSEDEGILFRLLPKDRAGKVFSHLPVEQQAELVSSLSSEQTAELVGAMSPDDRVMLLDDLPAEVTRRILEDLPPQALAATRTLLGYPADSAGHVMTPEYVALRPDMTAHEAIDAVRRSTRRMETFSTLFVVDPAGRYVSDLSLAELVKSSPDARVGDLDLRAPVAIPARTELTEVVRMFKKYDRNALPVVDDAGLLLGIITVDDALDISQTEDTESAQRFGGLEAIETPYARTPFTTLLRKRGGWLSVLFLGEMLTATAMGRFQHELEAAVILAMFIPLIISSGGNSGSQAATLIVRSLALGELQLRDWWRVGLREAASGGLLGCWLGLIGFARVILWQRMGWYDFGPHYVALAATVWVSLVGVVAFGTMTGSMLPFLLRAARLDPATSSAPFVATLVDVTGLVIYFTAAALILRGTVL